jgi:hypothetical protein
MIELRTDRAAYLAALAEAAVYRRAAAKASRQRVPLTFGRNVYVTSARQMLAYARALRCGRPMPSR